MAKFKCCVEPKLDYIEVVLEDGAVVFQPETCFVGDPVVLSADSIRALRKKLKKYLIAIEENDPARNGDSN